MQKKRKKVLIITLLALSVLYLVTWGIHVDLDHDWRIKHPQGDSMDNNYYVMNPPYMYAWMDGDGGEYGIPYMLFVSTDKLPYNLHVGFFVNEEEKPDGIVVDHLKIEHDNGRTYILVKPANPKTSFFRSTQMIDGIDTHAYITLPNSIKHRSSFTIEARGHFYNGDNKIPFERTIELRYIRKRYVWPGWLVYMMRGL